METSFINISKISSLLCWHHNLCGIKGELQQCHLWGQILKIKSLISRLCHVGITPGQLLHQVQGFLLFGSLALSAPCSRPGACAGEEELTRLCLLGLHSSAKRAAHNRAEKRRCSAWCRSQECHIMQINTPIFFRMFLSSWHKGHKWHDIIIPGYISSQNTWVPFKKHWFCYSLFSSFTKFFHLLPCLL